MRAKGVLMSTREVAASYARRRAAAAGPKRTIGIDTAAYDAVREAAETEGVPIRELASAAVFAGLEEARRVIREEIEATAS